ncbi:hypothetical protein M3Y99_01969800 [Aphelenchoides fujianensis]|nr:hypothetical protein M3Y99_01969800 [Aphelenchoides fujianensis]
MNTNNRVLTSSPLVQLGDISYSVGLVLWALLKWRPHEPLEASGLSWEAGVFLFSVAVAVGFVVEETSKRLRAHLTSWMRLLLVVAVFYAAAGGCSWHLMQKWLGSKNAPTPAPSNFTTEIRPQMSNEFVLLGHQHPNLLENQTVVNGSQLIVNRAACSMEGFEEADIIRLNSHPLPKKNWTYGPADGICKGENRKECTARPLKTAFCMVHKTASAVMHMMARGYCKRSASNVIRGVKLQQLDENMSTDRHEWAYVSVVRDPLERFLSGYIHLCY